MVLHSLSLPSMSLSGGCVASGAAACRVALPASESRNDIRIMGKPVVGCRGAPAAAFPAPPGRVELDLGSLGEKKRPEGESNWTSGLSTRKETRGPVARNAPRGPRGFPLRGSVIIQMYKTRGQIRDTLEEIREMAATAHKAGDAASVDKFMLEGWRTVQDYIHWFREATANCQTELEMFEWDEDGCKRLCTGVLVTRVLQIRSRCKRVSSRPWRERVPALQVPNTPGRLLDTIDPFPTYATRCNFLFDFVRVTRLGPGRALEGGAELLVHALKRSYHNQVAAILISKLGTPGSDSDLRQAASQLLAAGLSAQGYEQDLRTWYTTRESHRCLSFPVAMLEHLPRLRTLCYRRLGKPPAVAVHAPILP